MPRKKRLLWSTKSKARPSYLFLIFLWTWPKLIWLCPFIFSGVSEYWLKMQCQVDGSGFTESWSVSISNGTRQKTESGPVTYPEWLNEHKDVGQYDPFLIQFEGMPSWTFPTKFVKHWGFKSIGPFCNTMWQHEKLNHSYKFYKSASLLRYHVNALNWH